MASLVLGAGGAYGGAAIGAEVGSVFPGIGTAIGAAIGAAVGGVLGGTVGGFLDSQLLFPALVGRQTTFRGERLTDIPLTTASLGSPINYCIGRQNRIPGTVIWVSPLRTVPSSQHLGGKGGTNVVQDNYFVSVAVAICEGPISAVRKVWADGILIYDEGSNVHGGIDNRYDAITFYDGTQGNDTGAILHSGTATNGDANTITLDAGASGTDGTYEGCTIHITAGTGSAIVAGGETAQIIQYSGTTKVAKIRGTWPAVPDATSAFSIYAASADPTIQAISGATPMYVGTAYCVIVNLNTGPWGQRIPNFNFLVEAQEQCLLADAVSMIWERAGRSVDEIDVSWLAADEVVGYRINGPQSPASMLEPLLTAYDVVLQEQDGVYAFRRRQDAVSITLDPSKFAAYEDGGAEPIRAIQIDDPPDFNLPKQVVVTHTDPAMFFQAGAQRAIKRSSVVNTATTVDLPIVMAATDAKAIAKRILWSTWAERWSLTATLMPSQIHLLESDLFSANVDGYNYQGRVATLTQGANYILEMRGRAEQQSILVQPAQADIPGIGSEPEPSGSLTHTLVLIETGIMPGDVYQQGVHFAVSRSVTGDSWPGGAVYTSGNSLINYALWYRYIRESILGVVQSGILPNNPALGIWDHTTQITVQFNSPNVPYSVSEDEVIVNWMNHAYIGLSDGTGEVIAFQTVTQIDDVTFVISDITRGRLGTDTRTNGHATLEYFVLLGDAQNCHWVSTGDVGVTVYHKPHAAGNTPLKDISPVSSLRQNAAQMPWAPCAFSSSRDGSNNLAINWSRRCNVPCTMFMSPLANVPQMFPTLEYDFVIYTDNTYSTIAHTYRVTGNEAIGVQNSWTYTAARQTTDGLTPGNPVYAQVFQINANLGWNANRGFDTKVTL